MENEITIRVSRRWLQLAVGVAVLAMVSVPLGVLASDSFGDVPNDHIFHDDISRIVDLGITSGCGGGNYCPSANVTRGQMARFLNNTTQVKGTVAAYATVEADGTLRESFSKTGAAVTAERTALGAYTIDFGFQIRPDQSITVNPRETFGIQQCNVFNGDSAVDDIDVFCHNAASGSPAADVAFNVVVLN